MKSLKTGKIWIAMGLLVLLVACAPKRRDTEFSKNKAAEAGQTYTEDQLRTAIGSDKYDQLVAGIGADNLNLLTYGVGISNMAQMINGITAPGKLTSLMSNGPNSLKLTALEVLDLLNKLDDACQLPGSFGTDTIGKMVNMINNVSLAGMEGVKNIVHGVQAQASDPNGVPYTSSGTARLGLMISLLNENLSVMPTLVNDLAAPKCSLPAYTTNGACTAAGGTWTATGVFSAVGNAKLVRLVNEAYDMRDIAIIINGTTSLSNITAVMAGLNGNMYCSKPWYNTQATCTGAAGTWTNTNCTNAIYSTRAACTGGGGTWSSDGIENMAAIINQLNHTCTSGQTNGTACIGAGGTWYSMASKIPVIVNNISNVPNMYTIVNGLTNDGVIYAGGTPDGVDTMVASMNNIYNAGMGDTGTYAAYGTNGTKRLAYMVNQLDPNPQFGNDSDFENGGSCSNSAYETQAACTAGGGTWTANAGYNCTTGNFDNRLNWAFSHTGSAAAPFNGNAFGSTNAFAQGGSCSLTNDNTAAVQGTVTQSAEQIFNITTAGTATFYTKTDTLQTGDVLRYFIDDVLQATYTNASGAGFQLRTTSALATGAHRLRFDVQRLIGSTGKVYIDTVTLPGTKGAGRSAAEKTYIMMNNLYLSSSITNVATMINTVTAPACVATPLTCTPDNVSGMDTLVYIVNRSEYPLSLATVPNLATTVNTISNLSEMTAILNAVHDTPGTTTVAQGQLVSMMDHVQTPANIPLLVNSLGSGGGAKTATIITNLTAAGTSSMLRVMANFIAGGPVGSGATVADLSTMINGANTTGHIGVILTELTLSGNLFLGKSATVTFTTSPGTVVVNWASHGYTEGSPIQFATTASLPKPLVNGTIYYIKNVAANSFNLSATRYGATITTTSAGSGTHTAYATGEQYFASPVGGVKLAQFMNQVNKVATQYGQACNASAAGTSSQFCLKNHMIRLLNDIAGSAAGPGQIADIVGGMRPDQGPSAQGASSAPAAICTLNGCTGVQRMVNVMYDVRVMDAGTCKIGVIDLGYVANSAKCTAITGYCSVGSYPDAASCGVGGGLWTAGAATWTAPGTQYTSGLMNSTTDNAGRLTAMIAEMGASGGVNTGRMVNEVEAKYLTSLDNAAFRVSYLITNINRMRYLSRMLSEMNSADLMLQLLNSPNTNIVTIRNLINGQGNLAYGTNATATSLGSFNPIWQGKFAAAPASPVQNWTYYNTTDGKVYRYNSGWVDVTASYYMDGSQTGHAPNNALANGTGYAAAGSGLDTLGRLIQFINGITSGIENVVTLINVISDVKYMGAMNGVTVANSNPLAYNPDQAGDRNCYDDTGSGAACGIRNYGFGMINEANRINYLSNLLNGVANLDLFLTIVNGPGSCSLAYNSRSTCIAGGGTWTEGTMGACSNTAFTTQTSCTGGGGTWTANSPIGPNSAHYGKMISIVNEVAGSTRKGTGTKTVGDITILSDTINDLGVVASTGLPETIANQSRIITVMNDVTYCGVHPSVDRTISTGPNCSIAAYTNHASCRGAGGTWNNGVNVNVLQCTQPGDGTYTQATEFYDARNRVANTMLGVNDSRPMATIVGGVTTTQKTVRLMNGFRRINAMIKIVNWLPGEATKDLVNYTNFSQIYTALVYIGNNISGDENKAAKAFAGMIFWGTTIGQGGSRNTTPCMSFTAVGPRRMAGIMNTESGAYLEGLLLKFGWRTVIPLMGCGLSPHGSSYESYGGYTSGPSWTTSGTSVNPDVGGSTTCSNATAQQRCQTIPGAASSVNFKQKEQIVTYGSCSNASYHTYHTCTTNGGTWTDDTTPYTWVFGIKNATFNANCKLYYPEAAGAYGHSMPLDDTVFLGASVWGNSINAGIGGVWDILKGAGLIGWMLNNSGSLAFPPNVGAGYSCYPGGGGDEWSCVKTGMASGDNISDNRWGNQCSIPYRSATNCNASAATCEGATCQGRWITDKDFTFASCGIDPSTGVEPVQ